VRLRELLRDPTVGELRYLHAIRANLGRLRRDENALWSFGPHDLSMLDYCSAIAGERDGARAERAAGADRGRRIPDAPLCRGELAHLHLSWLHPRKERRLTLVCAHKMLEFDDVSSEKLRIYDKGFDRLRPFTQFAEYLTIRDGDVHIPSLAMKEPLSLEIAHFWTASRPAPSRSPPWQAVCGLSRSGRRGAFDARRWNANGSLRLTG